MAKTFTIKGEGPSGWSITGGDGSAFYLCVIVLGSEKNAKWVEDALNTALRNELEALDQGG